MSPASDRNPGQQPSCGGPFRRVLVAWDGSADSIVALRTATAIVGTGAGHVVALAVLATAARREADKDGPSELAAEQSRLEAIFETTRAAIARASSARVDLQTVQGRQAAASVCDYATEHGFDLLVVGRHSGGLIHPKLGRVAQAAARSCVIPVLLVSA